MSALAVKRKPVPWERFPCEPLVNPLIPAVKPKKKRHLTLVPPAGPLPFRAPFLSTLDLTGVTLSATSGTGPLGILFDATGATSSLLSNLFHDGCFVWDFGDPTGDAKGNTTWPYGSYPGQITRVHGRDQAFLPVATHIYDPVRGTGNKTFTATLYVTDDDGVTYASRSWTISVTDPDITYAGAATIVVANGAAPVAGVDGVPPGATCVGGLSDLSAIMATYAAANIRILLKHDDAFTLNTTGIIFSFSNFYLGMYGSGASPNITSTAAGTITLMSVGDAAVTGLSGLKVCDLTFDGQNTGAKWFSSGRGSFDDQVWMRMQGINMGGGVDLDFNTLNAAISGGHPGHTLWDKVFYERCVLDHFPTGGTNIPGFAFHASCHRLGINGCLFGDNSGATGGAVFRLQYVDSSSVSNSTFRLPNPAKQALTIRGPEWVQAAGSVIASSSYTENVCCSNLKFEEQLNPTACQTAPSGTTQDDRIRNVIHDSHWHVAGAATGSANLSTTEAVRITRRNCLFDMSGSAATNISSESLEDQNTSAPAADSIWSYNNTTYDGRAHSGSAYMVASSGCGTVELKNNLVYLPNVTNVFVFSTLQGSPASLTMSGNTNDTPDSSTRCKTDPNFASATPAAPADFKIQTASYAKAGGVTRAGAALDFFGNRRVVKDIGLHAFDETGTMPWEVDASSPPTPVVPRGALRTWAYAR